MNEEEKKELYRALVTGDGLRVLLEDITSGEEYNFASDAGEPDLEYVLIVRLLETILGHKVGWSLVNSEEWKEHALKGEG